MITWILVAHGTEARLIEVKQKSQALRLVQTFSHVQTAKKAVDENTEHTGTLGHAIDYSGDIEQHERHVFAKSIADFLEHAAQTNSFSTLVIVAPPKLLGEIRQATDHFSKRFIVHELHKDLLSQGLSDEELVAKIRNDLPVPRI